MGIEIEARRNTTVLLKKKYSNDDLCFSLDCAAEFLENEEWPEDSEREQVMEANKEAIRRIRRMSERINFKRGKK